MVQVAEVFSIVTVYFGHYVGDVEEGGNRCQELGHGNDGAPFGSVSSNVVHICKNCGYSPDSVLFVGTFYDVSMGCKVVFDRCISLLSGHPLLFWPQSQDMLGHGRLSVPCEL